MVRHKIVAKRELFEDFSAFGKLDPVFSFSREDVIPAIKFLVGLAYEIFVSGVEQDIPEHLR